MTGSLPFGRVLGLEVASTFVSLAGSGPAVPATGIRFFQLQGCPATVAVSSGALDGASDLIIKLVLFLIAVPVPWHEFRSENSLHAGSHAKVLWLILAIVVVTGLVIAVVLAVPKWRHQVSGKLRKGWGEIKGNFKELAAQPRKFAQLFGRGAGSPARPDPGTRHGAARLRCAPVASCPHHRGHRCQHRGRCLTSTWR